MSTPLLLELNTSGKTNILHAYTKIRFYNMSLLSYIQSALVIHFMQQVKECVFTFISG